MSDYETVSGDFSPVFESSSWTDRFTGFLSERFHGENLQALASPKPEVAKMAEHFAGHHMQPEALEVAKIAHIAELRHHFNLGPNIRRGLECAFGEDVRMLGVDSSEAEQDTELQLRYTLSLLRDFPVIADFIRAHESKCERFGHKYVDINGLVDLIEDVNLESIIIKSALDYSNFLLLESKSELTTKEAAKMERVLTAIQTVDSPLLALTGFDALEAELLSKAYAWELKQMGEEAFVVKAEEIFESLGGRLHLSRAVEDFLQTLFVQDAFMHDPVSAEQENYGILFTDGSVRFGANDEPFRVLARLKSTGSTAKKIRTYFHETVIAPMDIVGMTMIARDEDEMKRCVAGVMDRLSQIGVKFQPAPRRTEEVHVKGSAAFIDGFGTNSDMREHYGSLTVEDEPCSNGYAAVKITFLHTVGDTEIPIEIQITHETARKEGRVGLGAHTLFKLMKLAGDSADVTIRQLSTDELLGQLRRISERKHKFKGHSYETNGSSWRRGRLLLNSLARAACSPVRGDLLISDN